MDLLLEKPTEKYLPPISPNADQEDLIEILTQKSLPPVIRQGFHANDWCSDTPAEIQKEHPELAARYRRIHRIGKGSQGTMMRAEDSTGTTVAIKVFDLHTSDNLKDLELFEREIKTLETLNVHGVPKYIDSFQAGRYLYLVESYFDAPSIQDILDQGIRYNAIQLETILVNAARILEALQECVPPVIHRDIKPANILIDQNLNVYLVDFGVVAAKHQSTIAETFAGTAGYIAPEQLYGKVTPAADIFSLGMTLLHLISDIAPCHMQMKGMGVDIDRYLPVNLPLWMCKVLIDMITPDASLRIQSGTDLLRCIVDAKMNISTQPFAAPKNDTQPPDSTQNKDLNIINSTLIEATYSNFDDLLHSRSLSLIAIPLLLLFFLGCAYICVCIFLSDEISFMSSWLPFCMPIIMLISALAYDLDYHAPNNNFIIQKRLDYLQSVNDSNSTLIKELVNPNPAHEQDLIYKSDRWKELLEIIESSEKNGVPTFTPLNEDERVLLKSYQDDDTILYPCLYHDLRKSSSNRPTTKSIFWSLIWNIIAIFTLYYIIPSHSNFTSQIFDIYYYALTTISFIPFFTVYYRYIKYHRRRLSDERNIKAFELYERSALEEILKQRREKRIGAAAYRGR